LSPSEQSQGPLYYSLISGVILMSMADAINIVRMYLFGTSQPSTADYNQHITREGVLTPPEYHFSAAAYMTTGAGRYAFPSLAPVVKAFFEAATLLERVGQPYSYSEVMQILGLDAGSAGKIFVSQYSTDVYSQDYAERAFLFGSTSFRLNSETIRFHVEGGKRWIENLQIIPDQDNWDFVAGSTFANYLNIGLQAALDPYEIGQTVALKFDGESPSIPIFTGAMYSDSLMRSITLKSDALSMLEALAVTGPAYMQSLTSDPFLSYRKDGRNVIYGSNGSDLFSPDSWVPSWGNAIASSGDIYVGANDADIIIGGAFADKLLGGAGQDDLAGEGGNDTLHGGEDNDTITGGKGRDIITGGKGVDELSGDGDNDVLYGGDNDDILSGGDGNDFLNGGGGVDHLSGGAGNDLVYDQGGMGEVNTLNGGEGNDLLELGLGDRIGTFDGGDGNDFIISKADAKSTFYGGDGNDVIIGAQAGEVILGGEGSDNIEAGGGDDGIDGGGGSDYLRGGAGNDQYLVLANGGTDLISDDSGSLFGRSGGAYQDKTLAFESSGYEYRKFQIGGFSALMINAKGDEKNTLFIDRWQDGQLGISLSGQEEDPQRPNIAPTTANALPENNNVDVIRSDGGDGGQGNDILIGTSSQSLLSGGLGNDILDGRDGDDWLEGGEGSDLILTGKGADVAYGGDGDDIIRVGYTLDWYDTTLSSTGEDALFFRAGSGFTPVAGTNTQDPFVYYVNGVERQIAHPQMAVFDFKFTPKISDGENYDGKLWWWNVGESSVSMEPSLNITVTVGDPENVRPGDHLGEEPSSNLGTGIDYKVFLGEAKDILQVSTGEKGARAWGGGGNDILYGGNDSDKLHGDVDNDVLVGYDGADELYGDAGEDELSGGNGRDFLDGGTENDTLVGGLGADVLSGGTGDDRLIGDAMYQTGTNWYPAGLDEGQMGGDLLYGGAGNDKLWGNNGDDYLFGGADNDIMSGGADNDHLFGEEGDDVLMGGGGDDYLDGGSGTDTLYDDADGKDERGQENKSHDIFFGRAGDDHLDGGAGDDILDGGDDKDILRGGDGNDILRGGAGKDSLYGDNGIKTPGMDILEGGAGDDDLNAGGDSDMYIFNLGDGKDTIQDDGSSGSHNVVVFKFSTSQIKKVARSVNDLVISYGVDDSVTVKGYYGGGFSYGYEAAAVPDVDEDLTPQAAIAQICFEDGTVWSREDIYELAPPPVEPIVDPFAAANLPYFVNALLSRETVRSVGKHALTYSFAETFSGGENNAYLFTDEQKAAVRAALAKFSAVIDVTFTEVASGEDSDLRYILDDLTSADSGAFAGYASSQTGEIHLNSNLFSRQYANEFGELRTKQTLTEGESGFEVLLHETGHALGLKHPFELPLLPGAENNNANTVMSYTRTVEPARQLAAFDVAALQFFYGVAQNTKTGDDTYSFADKYVYDANGVDTFDASQETEGVIVDLAQGGWSSVGERHTSILAPKQTYVGHGTQIENAIGGSGNDRLIGSALANALLGGEGDDSLVGNKGDDLLQGGLGIDAYRFSMGDGQDTIIDAEGLSRIELNGVTADQVYWHNGHLYYGTEGDRIAVGVEQIGELVIGNDSYVGQAIADALSIILGSADSESLVGSDDADRMRGLNGDDALSGLAGNDSIEGGLGKDTLQGDVGDDVLSGGAGDDSLYGGTGVDVLDGGADNDELQGDANNDVLRGSAGNDSLYGGAGDDVLDGGAGSDVLYGGTGTELGGGNDTFRFGRGSGQDTIHEAVGDFDQDKIQIVGVSDRELAFSLVGKDLLISIIGTEDSLLVSRYFDGSARTIETIELEGGMSLSKSDVFGLALTNNIGGTGPDELWGNWYGNNRLEGKEGDDTLIGGDRYNLFIGGLGNDSMTGRTGNDTYFFNLGDGQDFIEDNVSDTVNSSVDQVVFGSGLTSSDIIFSARSDLSHEDPRYAGVESEDLIVTFANSSEQLIIDDFFSHGRVEYFSFSDGSRISAGEVLELVKRTTGTEAAEILRGGDGADYIDAKAGDDSICGFAGNDTIHGADGDDRIYGGEGDDVVVGGTGRDSLYGQDGNDTLMSSDGVDVRLDGGAGNDVLEVGAGGESIGQLRLYGASGSDTYVLHTGMGRVSLEDKDFDANAVDTIEFADLNLSDVKIKQDMSSLTITSLKQQHDQIVITGLWSASPANPYVPSPDSVVDLVRFADGSEYTIEQIIQMSLKRDSYRWLFANELRGTRANDSMIGGDGPDIFWAYTGDDLLLGGHGDDLLYGMEGSDTIEGGAGNDTLYGGGDYYEIGDGVNTLVGGAGNDLNIGGNGDDTFVFGRGDGSDTIDSQGTLGNDTLKFGAGVLPEHVQLYRDNMDLVAVIDGGSTQTRIMSFFNSVNLPVEQILFENGTVWSSAQMQAQAITGSVDQLTGDTDNDIFIIDNASDAVTEVADAGIDEVRSSVSYLLPLNVENFTATGLLNLTIRGNSANNVLRGNINDNEFHSGGGNDLALGGLGDDTYYIDFTSGELDVEEYADEGNDTLRQVDGRWYSSYRISLPDNVENLIMGTSDIVWFNSSNEVSPRQGHGNGLDNLIQGDRKVENELDGFGGRDTLVGGSRADVFWVDREDDIIIDRYTYDDGKNESARTLQNSKNLFAKGDLVKSSAVRYTLGENLEHLYLVGGAGAVDGSGNALNNTIVGNLFANRIEGGAGSDRLFDSDPLFDAMGQLIVDHIYYDYGGSDTIIGGEGDDQIIALYGDDRLEGGTGDDLITSTDGFATLIGGKGNDTLSGNGLGTIYLWDLGDGNDVIEVGGNAHIEGLDSLIFGPDVLPTQVTLVRTGSEGVDLLLNVIGGGSVQVRNYFLSSIDGGAHNSALGCIKFADGSTWSRGEINGFFGLPVDFEGTDGNDEMIGASLRDILCGLAGADTLIGGEGDDQLEGGYGNDSLYGGLGYDILVGGMGDDMYRDEDDHCRIVETVDGGIDTLEVSTSGILWDNVEIGIITSNAGGSLYGNDQSNTLIGNAGDDWLEGNFGNDYLDGGYGDDGMYGGLGADTYYVDSEFDEVVESGDMDYDTVFSSVSYTAPYYVEKVELLGYAHLSLTGNNQGVELFGNSGNNTIKGGGGGDLLYGKSGVDILMGGSGNDIYYETFNSATAVIIERANEGSDTIFTLRTHTQMADNVERALLFGTAARTVSGNAGNNTISGTEFNNTLRGNGGNDILNGNMGDDTYLYARGDGVDQINDQDITAGNEDWLKFEGNIAHDQLWFRQDGKNLRIDVIGTMDAVYINGWFTSASNKVEFIEAGGSTLNHANVNTLVQAMAAFTPPASGETTLSASYQQQLSPLLAAAWSS
jgi:Ca2+-binding RTX toxin-like protein